MASIALYIHQEQTDQHGARCPQATDGMRLKQFMTRKQGHLTGIAMKPKSRWHATAL